MKTIFLTQNKVAIVDDADFEFLNQFKWQYHLPGYAWRTDYSGGKKKTVPMHRLIINTPKGMETDHINGNGLDNRRNNLRFATKQENQMNQRVQKRNKSSKYKGVNWHKVTQKWQVRIHKNKVVLHIGCFDSEKEAALAYNLKAQELFGEFARLNIINNQI